MFDYLADGQWWDVGLELVPGCTKVSLGCDNCWSLAAANMRRFNPNPKTAARYNGVVKKSLTEGFFDKTENDPKNMIGPPQWTGQVNPQWQDLDKIGRSRTPKVYTFWTDLFHPGVSEDFIKGVLSKAWLNLQHFYNICTKRPQRALDFMSQLYRGIPGLTFNRRLMLMTTAENQEMADRRLPVLLQIPGVLHGVSVEPGLGLVDLNATPAGDILCHCDGCMSMTRDTRLDWVICGGETGPHARPMHPDIPRKLRDQCQAAGVPFFFKAWGEWTPGSDARKKTVVVYNDGRTCEFTTEAILEEEKRSGINHVRAYPVLMSRVGKKAAGRLLDGRTWEEIPNV